MNWGNIETMENELNKRIKEQKRTTIGTALCLICKKMYGKQLDNVDEVLDLVHYIEEKHPKIYEALYENYWKFTNCMLNEDGTPTEECRNWEDHL